MAEPTRRELAILSFLYEYRRRAGFMPTQREIGVAFGSSSSGWADPYLQSLCQKGLLGWDHGKSRALRLTRSGLEAVGVTPEAATRAAFGAPSSGIFLPERACGRCGLSHFSVGRVCPGCERRAATG